MHMVTTDDLHWKVKIRVIVLFMYKLIAKIEN